MKLGIKLLAGPLVTAMVNAGVYRTVALIASMDEAASTAARADIAKQLAGVQRAIESLATNEAMDTQVQADVRLAMGLVDTYAKQADAAIHFAELDPNTGISAMRRAELPFKELVKVSKGITTAIENASDTTIATAKDKGRNFSRLMAGVAMVTGFAVVWVAWRMQTKIVNELSQAAAVASQVAQGNLTIDAHTNRSDEVGDVMRALGQMTEQLHQSLTTVQESSESIRIASAEIAMGNLDLSVRTEQTSSNLQKASVSTGQLTGTVQQSAAAADSLREQVHRLAHVVSAFRLSTPLIALA